MGFKLCALRSAARLLLIVVATPAAAGSTLVQGTLPPLVLTADVGGQVDSCGSCSASNRRGGAASWQAAADTAGAVWLDAGGFLFGAAEPERVAGAFAALDYGAINLAAADFRLGLAYTLGLAAEASLPVLSTNLLGADGAPIAAPFRVVDAGGSPLAVVGITEPPAALAFLPTLQEQLAGLTFEDPFVALDRVLPQAEAAADRVVLLVHGTRPLVDRLRARYGSRLAAICVGGMRASEADRSGPSDTAPTMTTRPGATHLVVLAAGEGAPRLVPIPVSPAPNARVLAALNGVEQEAAASERGSAPSTGLRLKIHGTEHLERIGDRDAKAGHAILVLDLEVQNDIPLDLAFGGDRIAGERLKVAQKQNLLLIWSPPGSTPLIIREALDISGTQGALRRSFELQTIGSKARGQVAFEVPLPVPDAGAAVSGDGGDLALWLEHDELDPSVLMVFGALPTKAPLVVAQGNEYLGFATPGVRFAETIDDRTAPAGLRWVEVALEGTSLRSFDGVRPKAAMYLAAPLHMQLVTDGMWAHQREESMGTLPAVPGFVPGYGSGGTAVFLIPDQCDRVALELVFPILQHGGGSGVHIKPKTLVFELEGSVPAEGAAERALVMVDDEPVDMAVVGLTVVADADDRSTVELDVRLIHRGDDDGELDLAERFRGDGILALGTFGPAGEPLASAQLLPARSRRAFRVRLDVADSLLVNGSLELSYVGIKVNPTLRLPLGEPGAVSPSSPIADDGPLVVAPVALDSDEASASFAGDSAIRRTLEPGHVPTLAQVRASGENAAVELAVEAVSLVKAIGTHRERKGIEYLVLDTRWRRLPMGSGDDDYQVGREQQLHLVYNHRRLLRDRGNTPDALGRTVRFRSGRDDDEDPAQVSGQIVYAIPAGQLRSASLHLLDPEHGNITLDLVGPPGNVPTALATARNRSVEASVFGVEVLPTQRNTANCVVAVDLRVSSLRVTDPRDFHGRAEPLAQVLDPKRSGSVHLLFNGEFPANCSGDELESPLWCLPGAMAGGPLLFKVPRSVLARAKTIELVVNLPETAQPRELIRRPAPLVLPLVLHDLERPSSTGPLPGLSSTAPATWEVEDAKLSLSFLAVATPGEHPHWLDLAVQLENHRSVPVLWEPVKALELVPVEATVDASDALPHTKPERSWPRGLDLPIRGDATLWIPAGATRTVQLRFKADAPSAFLRYNGLLRRVDLPFEGVQAVQAPALDRSRTVKGLAGVGVKGQDVNEAIAKACQWMMAELKRRPRTQGNEGYQLEDLVMLLALVHADAHRDFPDFDEQLQTYLDQIRPGFTKPQPTYRNGFLAMLLDAYSHPRYRPLLRDVATYLVNAQGPSGTWSYEPKLPPWLFELQELPESEPQAKPDGSPLTVVGGAIANAPSVPSTSTHAASSEPLRRKIDWNPGVRGDNSLTQYAILGLHAAERQGIAIDPDVWRRSLSTAWKRQTTSGGWSYVTGRPYGTMTCAGSTIASIAMRTLEPARDPLLDPRLHAGLDWLAKFWSIERNPDEDGGRDSHLYYHYYGLERTGRLLDTEFYGAHEWYATIAKRLLHEQNDSGAWPAANSEKPELTTAFAVLFLTRATESLDPAVLARERAAKKATRPKTGRLVMHSAESPDRSIVLVLDASGSMLAPPASAPKADRTPKFEHARAALRRVIEALPEGAPVGLVVYGHRKRAREEGANSDVETLIPVAPLQRALFLAALDQLKPRGKTPLALALDEALKALPRASRKDSTIVLLTDGGQGREPGDPIESAKRVGRAKVALKIIAFDLGSTQSRTQATWNQQLAAMAEAAGGTTLPVPNPADLASAVSSAATATPGPCTLKDSTGTIVYEGAFGAQLKLPPGKYLLRTTFAAEPYEVAIHISRGRTTRIEFDAAKAN